MDFLLFFLLFFSLVALTSLTYYTLVCDSLVTVGKRSLAATAKFTLIGLLLFGFFLVLNFL